MHFHEITSRTRSAATAAATAALIPVVALAASEPTVIYEDIIIDRGIICDIAIVDGSPDLCAGSTETYVADLTCADDYEQTADPTWLVDGVPVGTGDSIDLSFDVGTYVLTASCASCTDELIINVVDCLEQPFLDALFSNDATESSIGIFMMPNIAPVTAGNFSDIEFLMRPFTLDKDASLSSGSFIVDVVGGNIDLYEPDGTAISLPATYDVATDLPVTFYANATDFGEATVTASYQARSGGPLTNDEVKVRVGPTNGISGESIAEYPFFHFVDTFNADGTMEGALDGPRHAERDGLQYRAYVVAHKTAAQWDASATLIDLSGGFETETFSAASIQANRVTLWTGPMDPGTVVSKSYNIVYDFGLDGTLDPGDLIDDLTFGDDSGVYVVKDLTASGPYTVANTTYSGGSFLGQKTYYPTNIGSLGQVPLVVMSHGNGHQYTWYDYLGNHLASHGFVFMSHQNNTGPGIETASTTTLTNTDYFYGNLGTIAGGILDGHIDQDRTIWTGHSRGGEGVVRAYDKLFDGTFNPSNFDISDIILVSSIAPTVFLSAGASDPHDVNYHCLGAAGDGDVSGAPNCSVCQYFRLSDRAEKLSMTIYVQGADHNDFNCCGFNDYTGPGGAEIGRPAAQEVAKGYYLALSEHFGKESPATLEYLTRMFDDIKPSGINANVEVALSYMDRLNPDNMVLDDFQTNPSDATSSSGGAVTYDVSNLTETDNEDTNTSFTWVVSDPMNGMIYHSDGGDITDGVVFDYTVGQTRFLEFEVIPAFGDVRGKCYVSFRSSQGTRHPETVAHNGDHSYSVTLRDGAGTSSTIHFGAWGELSPLFQRTGAGTGAGWANELHTVRIPISSFEVDGSGIDLSDIVAVRLEFGAAFGSSRGRITVDDVQFMLE